MFKGIRARRLVTKIGLQKAKVDMLRVSKGIYGSSYYTDLHREEVLRLMELQSKLKYLQDR